MSSDQRTVQLQIVIPTLENKEPEDLQNHFLLASVVTMAIGLGTHARVFSQTLTHGNSKNEIRQWYRRRWTEERRVWEKVLAGTNKRSPDGLSHPNRNTIIINIIW